CAPGTTRVIQERTKWKRLALQLPFRFPELSRVVRIAVVSQELVIQAPFLGILSFHLCSLGYINGEHSVQLRTLPGSAWLRGCRINSSNLGRLCQRNVIWDAPCRSWRRLTQLRQRHWREQ